MAIDYKRHTGTMSFIEEQLFAFLHASLSCQIVATCLKPEMALIYHCMTGLRVLFLCSHDIGEKITLIFFARVWSLLWTATTGRGSQRPRRSSRKWWVVIWSLLKQFIRNPFFHWIVKYSEYYKVCNLWTDLVYSYKKTSCGRQLC